MTAPSGTVWGSIAGSYGKIGIYATTSSTNTQTTVTVQVWFWSKYSVSDNLGNDLCLDNLSASGSATTSKGGTNIQTTVATGAGWSTSNQVLLTDKSYTYTHNRGTSAATRYIYAKLTGVDRVGATMYASTTVSVPALTSYTISYNANGGSGAPSSQTKYYGKNITLSSASPTRAGYSFQGWATSASGSVAYAAGANYTANAGATLYAVWKANTYTVNYDANGGTGAPSSQTKTYGVTLTLSSTKPTRTNYNFLGWSSSASATIPSYTAGGSYTSNAPVTLYAVWELAYVAPIISNLKIERYDSFDMVESDTGTTAMVWFDWQTNYANPTVEFSCEAIEYIETQPLTGSSGSLDFWLDEYFDPEKTYTIKITVTDSGGYSTVFETLLGTEYTMDFLAGGKGAAFGKPAEKEGLLDVAWQTRHFGGLLPVVLEPETNLDDVLTPNTYTGDNISNYNYVNCPVSSGTFTLLVESCGEDGQVKQTYVSCSKYKPERYSRFYYQGEWGDWFWAGTDEVVLYEDESGTNGTVTLWTSASHYRYLEIFFTDNNGKSGGYTKVYSPNGKTVMLNIAEAASTIYYRQTAYTVSGTSMTPDTTTASYLRITSAGAVSTSIGTNYIKIVRVIGRA